MSDYLRKLDKQREDNADAEVNYQKAISSRGGGASSGSGDKKKNARMCLGFIIFLIIAVVAVVAISL